jgi:hypothetical protein
MQVNAQKPVHVTFTTRTGTCPLVRPHEQRAASLCGSSQISRSPPGQKTHLAPPYLH